mgnify:CR=1 FL=1
MEFKKNQIVELYIDDIGNEGEGIGHIDGYALFLKDAVIGDKVRAKIIKTKKNYGFARVEEVIEASKDRVSPRCSKARQCGGCTLQHLAYEKQLEYKFNKVKNCLERIGGLENIEEKMEPIIGMEEPFYYRNKAQFPVGYDKEGNLITGFYAGRTHHIIDCTHCMIQHPVNEQILLKVLDYMKKNNITAYDEKTHKGLVRHIVTRVGFKTGQIMVCLVVNGSKKNLKNLDKLVDSLTEIKGMTSILRADMKYTRLFAKIAFKSIPAKSIPVTIMLAGPIIFPTLEMVFVMSSGSRILVKNKMAPMAMEIILMLRMIFFQS